MLVYSTVYKSQKLNMGIPELADKLIPADVYGMSVYDMTVFYSPSDFQYLEKQNVLNSHLAIFNAMIRAFNYAKGGRVMAPWNLTYTANGYTRNSVNQNKLIELYKYYVDPKRNVKGSNTQIFSQVVNDMAIGWILQGRKYL